MGAKEFLHFTARSARWFPASHTRLNGSSGSNPSSGIGLVTTAAAFSVFAGGGLGSFGGGRNARSIASAQSGARARAASATASFETLLGLLAAAAIFATKSQSTLPAQRRTVAVISAARSRSRSHPRGGDRGRSRAMPGNGATNRIGHFFFVGGLDCLPRGNPSWINCAGVGSWTRADEAVVDQKAVARQRTRQRKDCSDSPSLTATGRDCRFSTQACRAFVARWERATGIEPAWPAWKAGTLPLSYARARHLSWREPARLPSFFAGLNDNACQGEGGNVATAHETIGTCWSRQPRTVQHRPGRSHHRSKSGGLRRPARNQNESERRPRPGRREPANDDDHRCQKRRGVEYPSTKTSSLSGYRPKTQKRSPMQPRRW